MFKLFSKVIVSVGIFISSIFSGHQTMTTLVPTTSVLLSAASPTPTPVTTVITTSPQIIKIKKNAKVSVTISPTPAPILTPNQAPVPHETPTPQVKTGYQICSDAFPNETWDGTYTSDGKYNCVCISGYQWNNSHQSCEVYVAPTYDPYKAEINYLQKQNQDSLSCLNAYQTKLDQAERDIRNEVQAAGGFATESQILATAINRVGSQPTCSTSTSIPTAICNDYTLTYSTDRQGSCSYHGGVMFFY